MQGGWREGRTGPCWSGILGLGGNTQEAFPRETSKGQNKCSSELHPRRRQSQDRVPHLHNVTPLLKPPVSGYLASCGISQVTGSSLPRCAHLLSDK